MKKYILLFFICYIIQYNNIAVLGMASDIIGNSGFLQKSTIDTLYNDFPGNISLRSRVSLPSDYKIDTSKSVGEIPMQQGVVNGTLTYNIPIEMHPSENNFAPEVSLNYNSLSARGIAGVGWNISGISSIYLANHNQYFDGFTSDSKMNIDGVYMLDGTRLIKTGSEDGIINYETERGKILVKGYTVNNIIKYFEVLYPNGQKAIFGDTENTSNQLSYPMCQIQDLVGNFISYKYLKDNNTYYISEITYGGTKNPFLSRDHYALLKFIYQQKYAFATLYTHGMKVENNWCIEKIETYFNNDKLRSYTFNYEKNRGLLLTEVNCESNGQSLNPLLFSYGEDTGKGFDITTLPNTLDNRYNLDTLYSLKAQFKNNTNNSGLLIYGSLPNYVKNYNPGVGAFYYTTAYAREISGPNDPILVLPDVTDGENHTSIAIDKGYLETLVGDVDGDGYDEIIKINSIVPNSSEKKEVMTYSLYKSNNGILENTTDLSLNYYESVMHKKKHVNNEPLYSPVSRRHLIGDFLGIGKDMVIRFSDLNNPIWDGNTEEEKAIRISPKSRCTLISLDKTPERVTEFDCFDISAEDLLFVIDYDGDGKADICHLKKVVYDNGYFAYLIDIYSFNENKQFYNMVNSVGYPGIAADILIGDINRDGKTDFLVRPPVGHEPWKNHWLVLLSKGSQSFEFKEYLICDNEEGLEFFLQDIDKDGILDLIKIKDKTTISVYLGSETGGFSEYNKLEDLTLKEPVKLVPYNIFQNNTISNLIGIQLDGILSIASKEDNSRRKLITRSITSAGIINNYKYKSILDAQTGFYKKTSDLSYPYNVLAGNINLIANTESLLGDNKVSSVNYKYTQGVVDRLGRGFLGFETIEEKDNLRNEVFSRNFDPKMFNVLKKEETPFNITTYKYYPPIVSENKIAEVLVEKRSDINLLNNVETETLYKTYDTYGNNTNITISDGGEILSETVTEYDNIVTDTIYKPGIPRIQTVTNNKDGKSVVNKTEIDYSSVYYPTNKRNYYNDNLIHTEKYEYYDSWSLKELKTKEYESADWLTTKYDYDSYGRIKSIINPLGLSTSYEYNNRGLLEYETNHRDHKISYAYDDFGKKIKTVYPDSTIETNNLAWVNSPTGALFVSTTSSTGKPETQKYFDALGRIVRVGQKRFDGSYLYTDNVYDKLGRLQKTSLPFKGTSPSLWNETDYDEYHRIKSITCASGKKDIYTYDKLQIKSVIDGLESVKTQDRDGKVIRVTDVSGSIKYKYRPDGQPESIIAPGNITTSFEYDKYGRQKSIIDPSAGTKMFEYDTSGNINKETDGLGKVTNLKYDKYGRLDQKEIEGEFSTTYKYTSDNLLESEISDNGTAQNYTYDDLLRLKTKKESIIDGKWLEKTVNYSADGNIDNINYKSQSGNIVTENYSYSNGQHTELKLDDTQSVWKLTAENDLGMPTTSATGAIERKYTYDAYGLPTGRILKNGNNTLQDFSYDFDIQTTNLKWRKDNTRGIKEDFTYDNLNRLTHFGSSTIQYNNQGNIIDHSSIGYFSYSQTKPYAIEKVEPYTDNLPKPKQNISYNALMRPTSIIENGYKTLFTYDTNGDRVKMNLMRNDTLQLNRYYIGGQYEIDETLVGNTERLYLGGDAYNAAAVYVKEGGSWTVNYIGRDYLGSITHVMDASGVLKQELSYDPWGRFRNPEDQTLYQPDYKMNLTLGDRGYTGHEHLQEFGLINMNARLYDPLIGRFLSPDPYVQSPGFSQNFNRYSYALNNPLRFTDPNGEFWQFVIAAAAGGLVNWISNGHELSWEGLSHFGIGAVAGAATLAAPNAFAYIAAGTAFSSNLVHQGFTQGLDHLSWQSAVFDGIISGATAYGIGKVLAMPGVANALGKLTGGITSPLLRHLANSYAVGLPLGAGMGAISGALDENSTAGEGLVKGLKKSVFTSTISGFGSAAQYSRDNGVNILTGNFKLNKVQTYNFTLASDGDNVTLYRGMTGHEGSDRALWMTTDPDYAATYSKTGEVVKIVMPKSTLFQMEQNNVVIRNNGLHGGASGIEYMFTPPGASEIIKNYNIIPK